MLVDSDEVWDAVDLRRAIAAIEGNPGVNVFRCQMHTYLRSPFFRVEPPEPHKPVVFVRRAASLAGVRGNRTRGRSLLMSNVFFHHFTAVRADELEIKCKILRSVTGDGDTNVAVEQWFAEKFLKLPSACNLHYTAGFEHCWERCRVVGLEELPPAVRELPIVQRYRS